MLQTYSICLLRFILAAQMHWSSLIPSLRYHWYQCPDSMGLTSFHRVLLGAVDSRLFCSFPYSALGFNTLTDFFPNKKKPLLDALGERLHSGACNTDSSAVDAAISASKSRHVFRLKCYGSWSLTCHCYGFYDWAFTNIRNCHYWRHPQHWPFHSNYLHHVKTHIFFFKPYFLFFFSLSWQ